VVREVPGGQVTRRVDAGNQDVHIAETIETSDLFPPTTHDDLMLRKLRLQVLKEILQYDLVIPAEVL